MADTFSRIFSSVLDVHAPLKRRKIYKKSTFWITPQVKQLMRERDQLKTRATNDSTVWPQYKVLRNKVMLNTWYSRRFDNKQRLSTQ